MYAKKPPTYTDTTDIIQSKAECTAPRVFKGECRNCGQEGISLPLYCYQLSF
jgi:hypothetical protein